MDNFDVAIALLREAQKEKARLKSMSAEIEKLSGSPDYWKARSSIESRYVPLPRKAVVNDNIKTARRLLMRERL